MTAEKQESEMVKCVRKPKNCYNNPHYNWLRVAIWRAHGCKDHYSGDEMRFREMEIDHIVSQELFRDPVRLQKKLEEFGLPETFQKDDLLNFVPTRRGANVNKYKYANDSVIRSALAAARAKKEEIIRLVDLYFEEASAVDEAAKIAANITDEAQRYNVVDIILQDTEPFEELLIRDTPSQYCEGMSWFVKSSRNVRLSGFLPTFQEPLPSCVIEFRTLRLRGISLCIKADAVLGELSRGIWGPLDGRLRPYLLKDPVREIYEWSIGNSRFYLGAEETQELCVILDEYVQTYIRELYRREREYDLEPFCLSRSGIRLFCVRAAICDAMFRYIENAPDRYEGLHLECNLGVLRLDNADGGLHFMIVLEREQLPVWSSDSEYWFTLKPYYGDADGIMDAEKLWPPAKVCSWLTDVLLPDALTYALQKAVPHGFLRGRRRKEWLKNRIDSEIKSLHRRLDQADRRIPNGIGNDRELYSALEKLQSRFALATSGCYFGDELQRVNETLILMLEKAELKQASYAYISGKLGCAGSKDSVLAYLRGRLNAHGGEGDIYSRWLGSYTAMHDGMHERKARRVWISDDQEDRVEPFQFDRDV